MTTWFWIVTFLFMLVALAMVLIILVQRPQGGGLAGAFGGAGGSSSETVFGGRVGDALTVATIVAFVLYLSLAIGLNILDNPPKSGTTPAATTTGLQPGPGVDPGLGDAGVFDTGATIPPPDDAVPIVDPSDSDQSNDDADNDPGER
ncbi:MAG: preprotein translocase subunit SecG [Phycisphaerales bacterium]